MGDAPEQLNLSIFGHTPLCFLSPYFKIGQTGSVRSNIHVVLVLLDKSIHQKFPSPNLFAIQSHLLLKKLLPHLNYPKKMH